MTFSRIFRASSLGSIAKYVFSSSITGRYAVALPYDTDAASTSRHPSVRCECVNSHSSDVRMRSARCFGV